MFFDFIFEGLFYKDSGKCSHCLKPFEDRGITTPLSFAYNKVFFSFKLQVQILLAFISFSFLNTSEKIRNIK